VIQVWEVYYYSPAETIVNWRQETEVYDHSRTRGLYESEALAERAAKFYSDIDKLQYRTRSMYLNSEKDFDNALEQHFSRRKEQY
jgi:hypothetical protein